MSDARRILDERLAKGEITAAEHDAMLAKIAAAPEQPRTPNKPKNISVPAASTFQIWKLWPLAVPIIIVFLGIKWHNEELAKMESTCKFTDAQCRCFIEYTKSHTSALDNMPLVRMLVKPSDARIAAMQKEVQQLCLGW